MFCKASRTAWRMLVVIKCQPLVPDATKRLIRMAHAGSYKVAAIIKWRLYMRESKHRSALGINTTLTSF